MCDVSAPGFHDLLNYSQTLKQRALSANLFKRESESGYKQYVPDSGVIQIELKYKASILFLESGGPLP